MKKTILMLAVLMGVLAGCKKDKDYEFKSGEFVYLNGVEQPKFKSTTTQYSLSDIVNDADIQMWYTWNGDSFGDGSFDYGDKDWNRGFGEEMRDRENNRLLMRAEDVLTVPDGRLLYDFIGGKNFHLVMSNGDTCGYIPNSVIASARAQIEALYAQERYDEIYELFHTAFTFYTCTGEEYKQIVANGGN